MRKLLWLAPLVDGVKLGEPVDCHSQRLEVSGQLSLGTMELSAGDHRLALEVMGINPKAHDAYQVGLDYIKLVPVK